MSALALYAPIVEAAQFGDLVTPPDPGDPFWPDDINCDVCAAAEAGCEQALACYADLVGFDLYPYDAAEGLRHLRRLFPAGTKGWIELRTAEPGAERGKRDRYWIRPRDLDDADAAGDLAAWVERYTRRRWPVWVGVAPRKNTSGGSADNLLACRWTWTDIDYKDVYGGYEEVERRLSLFQPSPSLLVYTGGGVHAYWEMAPHDGAFVRLVTQRLGGDNQATDPARVLRLAGTVNGKFDPPARVMMLERTLL